LNSVYIYYRLRHNSAIYVLLRVCPGSNSGPSFLAGRRLWCPPYP